MSSSATQSSSSTASNLFTRFATRVGEFITRRKQSPHALTVGLGAMVCCVVLLVRQYTRRRKPEFIVINRVNDSETYDFSALYHRQAQLQQRLSEEENSNVKVIHFIRHGEGIHNVAEKRHGREVWENQLVFDKKYRDPGLTKLGEQQCMRTGTKIKDAIEKGRMKVPDLVISSPFYRALLTAELAVPYEVTKESCRVVVELFRETNGRHQCDRRNNVASRVHQFPHFDFSLDYELDGKELKLQQEPQVCEDTEGVIDEEHFPSSKSQYGDSQWVSYTNEDVSFDDKVRESEEERNERAAALMAWLWKHPAQEIVLVGHSGIIKSSIAAMTGSYVWGSVGYLKNGEIRSFLVRTA